LQKLLKTWQRSSVSCRNSDAPTLLYFITSLDHTQIHHFDSLCCHNTHSFSIWSQKINFKYFVCFSVL
jgi:hypothetical protein